MWHGRTCTMKRRHLIVPVRNSLLDLECGDLPPHTKSKSSSLAKPLLLPVAIGSKQGEVLAAQRLVDPKRDLVDPDVLLGTDHRHTISARQQPGETVRTIGGCRRREGNDLVRVV